MGKYESIKDIMEYLNGSPKVYNFHTFASTNCVGKLDPNMSSEFSAMIKEAARCNAYASDLLYDIEAIKEMVTSVNPMDFPDDRSNDENFPVVGVGMRKMGVDGNSFILSRCNGECYNIYKEYFFMFFVTFGRSEYGSLEIVTVGYNV